MSEKITSTVRIVTAASLFDGHDAAINIMRRILQSKGAEIIHLGHNRSVHEIVECAIEEDANSIAITSYQGGHVEFFKYMKDLLEENGCGHIKIFGGGGGTIHPKEIEELHAYGITRIYSPDDGRTMGLEGMIEDVIKGSRPLTPSRGGGTKTTTGLTHTNGNSGKFALGEWRDIKKIAQSITRVEEGGSIVDVTNDFEKDPKATTGTSSTIVKNYFVADPYYYKSLKEFATNQKNNPTEAEKILWERLRGRKDGFKFRRQHIIDKYIADFVCLQKGVVIELDGNIHQLPEVKENDEMRSSRLNELGFDVLRFINHQILNYPDIACEDIFQLLEKKKDFISPHVEEKKEAETREALSFSPSPGGGRGAAVLGITGTGGAGKSSVTDEIVRRFLNSFPDKTIAVISVDPSKKKTGGALLGDRIRMNSIHHPRAYMRSLATRESDKALSKYVQEAIDICKAAGYDFIILESAGVGQGDASILDHCDISMYVMTPEYGAASQLEKINMLDYADIICINKFDKAGAKDALHDVKKQYKRNHALWDAKDDQLPVIGTTASLFNDEGINTLFVKLIKIIKEKTGENFGDIKMTESGSHLNSTSVIQPKRVRYLAEIADEISKYNNGANEQAEIASQLYQVIGASAILKGNYFEEGKNETAIDSMEAVAFSLNKKLLPQSKELIDEWDTLKSSYQKEFFEYNVRGKIIKQPLYSESLSHTKIPKISVPRFKDWGDILRWRLQENFPGQFPYTAGVFPLKRVEEDPTRMFAGEGGPERTNRRFHYVSVGQPAKRLSTAFDSVTLYGENPATRPDIYGKVGNSGVSVASVDDAKKLYSGFDLCDPKTSVSMTINGPAPMLLAFF